jgi:NAD+ synthase
MLASQITKWQIIKWIKNYAEKNDIKALVIGISGGIDSSVVSTLCAHTDIKTYVLTMPIKQSKETHNLSLLHSDWLTNKFKNVKHINIDLDDTYEIFNRTLTNTGFKNQLGFANSKSRIRMMTLYQVAQSVNGIVVGTGNKVEDFGVGFFTKYGDGGVDISPIADLMKTEVWQLGRELGVLEDIINAAPTDGLWDDGRTDEDQLGIDYLSLEESMLYDEKGIVPENENAKINLEKYRKIRARNLHKMTSIPFFKYTVMGRTIMITAAQAREKTDNSAAKIEKVLELISQQIESAALSGYQHIYLDIALSNYGYISRFPSSKPVENLDGAHKIICARLSENGYRARMVNHTSDLEYFKTIYSQLDQEDLKYSIKVTW